jgi:hypothetical protein
MTRGEAKVAGAVALTCWFATVAVGVGGYLLGASSDAIGFGYLLVMTIGGLGGGYAYDRYKHPPEKH